MHDPDRRTEQNPSPRRAGRAAAVILAILIVVVVFFYLGRIIWHSDQSDELPEQSAPSALTGPETAPAGGQAQP